ncbi:MAG TPA: ferredoxin [Deltaproteobacteria bacterium]|mgnify:CR=1 FL=1|jgi:ferredoxin|nr:ferredoxin [Deltaproteobacteria bacterium]HOI07350.1 ferredoxin [Deltaproteobacteria bacterium]
MRAEVDQIRCGTIGVCVKICPQVFRFHPGNKKAYVQMDVVPPEYEAKTLEAAEKCPNRAIIITF